MMRPRPEAEIAAPYLRPLALLSEAHVKGQAKLSALEAAMKALQNGERASGVKGLEEALGFFDTDLARHFKHEENALFPPLIRAVGRGGPVGAMMEEHQSLWRSIDRLTEQVEAMAMSESGPSPKELTLLKQVVEHILWLLRSHIQKEDTMLFPLALQHLSSSDWREVEAEMERPG
ncbi:MAG: hemerythrin domain-containing protein [Chloroflexi bacterium]|nr:hemerythrin domain-containing protein [Chloroflexota bacterium]